MRVVKIVAVATGAAALWAAAHLALGAQYALSAIDKVDSSAREKALVSSSLSFCQDMRDAWGWLNDPVVAAFELLPLVGQDLAAVRTVVGGAADICEPATELLTALDEEDPFASISRLSPKMLRNLGLDALARVDKNGDLIRVIKSDNLHFGLSGKVAKAQRVFAQLEAIKPDLKNLVSVGAAVLSSNKRNLWLVATQNLAEARGTGGILGSYAVIRFGGSGLQLVEAGSDQTLAKYGPVVYQNLPIDTAAMWGVEPGLWQDLNPSPNAPYAAEQVYDSWLKYKGQELAGVVFIGQGWAQNIVGLLGPVTIDEVNLDRSNTAEFLAKGIYSKYPDVDRKNDFVKHLMEQLSSKLASGKLDFKGFILALLANRTGDKMFAWAKDLKTEADLVADGAAGEVDAKLGNRVWVSFNNGGGNKLDSYLQTSADYRVAGQENGSSKSRLLLTLTNSAPSSGLPPYARGRLDLPAETDFIQGSNVELVSIHVPIGARVTSFFLDNQPYSAHDFSDRQHQVLSFRVTLNPAEVKEISVDWSLDEAFCGQSQPLLNASPMYLPMKIRYSVSGFDAGKQTCRG